MTNLPTVDNDNTRPAAGATDFAVQLDEYHPVIPDAVTSHLMSQAGLETTDARLIRLTSLAAQRFVSDLANDALQHYKIRVASTGQENMQQQHINMLRRATLTSQDLASALSDQGITMKKPPYYV